MTPSSTTSTAIRHTRTSSRVSATMSASGKTGAPGAAKGSAATKSNKPAKKRSGASPPLVPKETKRKAAPKAGTRKRTKQNDDEDDDDEVAEESSDDDDQEDYQQSDDDDDDDGDQDSDAADFEDTSYGYKPKATPKPKSKSKTSKASPSSAAKSKETKQLPKNPNPDLQPAPSRTIEVSTLVIPHPKNGPVADAIQPETLEFMRDLKLNNSKEFMDMNRARYEQAKADVIDFLRMVKEGLLEADPDVMDVEPKDSMMRINRDVRFSNDKSPYKKQFASFFSRGGRKAIAAGYYIGVTSGGDTFVGCGAWGPPSAALFRIRQGIVNHSDRFKAIMETDAIKKITGETGVNALQAGSSQLKVGPVGFDKNHEMIEYLKRTGFAVGRKFTDEEVVSEGFLEKVLQVFDATVDLAHILNEWIG